MRSGILKTFPVFTSSDPTFCCDTGETLFPERQGPRSPIMYTINSRNQEFIPEKCCRRVL